MYFNIILAIVVLFIVISLFYDVKKMYNSGNLSLVEGYSGPAYPLKAEIPYNMENTITLTFNNKLQQELLNTDSFNASIKDGSNVSIGAVMIDDSKLNLVLNKMVENNDVIVVNYIPDEDGPKLKDVSNNEIVGFTKEAKKTTKPMSDSSGFDSSTGKWPNSFFGNFMGMYDNIMKIPSLKTKVKDDCRVKCDNCKINGGNSDWCKQCRECLHSSNIISIKGEFVNPSDSVNILEAKAKYAPRDINNVGADFSCPKNCVLPDYPMDNCEFSIGEEGAYWKKCKKVCSSNMYGNADWSRMSESERSKQCWKNSDCNKCKAERYFPCNIEKGPDGKIIKWDCTTGYETTNWDNRMKKRKKRVLMTNAGNGEENNNQMRMGIFSIRKNPRKNNQGMKYRQKMMGDNVSAGSIQQLEKDNKTNKNVSAYNSNTVDKNNYSGTGYTKNYKPQDPGQKPSAYNSLWSIL